MHYEVKQPDGRWSLYDWKSKYVVGKYKDGEPKLNYQEMFKDPLYIGRNYDLFAILADVRNGTGFAGIVTGERKQPISAQRGLPADVSQEVAKESETWGCDGHSHSWLTLREVTEYDYDRSTVNFGVVSEKEFVEFIEHGKPRGWCGDVSGSKVRVVPNDWMRRIVSRELSREDGVKYYTKVEWKESYRDMIGDHWFKALDALVEMFGVDNVRLVFWFDN
jgi:hypothetical protein